MAKQELPEFKNQAQLNASVNVPSFQGVTTQIALQPSMLGQIATNLAMRASTSLAEKQGYEAGLKPQGDLGLPLTAADQAYQNAYYNQAHASLSLQANEMMQSAQLQLAQADKLTPELIESYNRNMKEGIDQILEMAPSKIKPGLQNQFNASLLQSMGNVTSRMITQQKKDMRDNIKLGNQNTTKELYENGVAGNFDVGQETLQGFNTQVDENVKSGLMSRVEGDGAKEGAKIALYSGKMAKMAADARANKKLEPFLNDMANDVNKPQSLTTSEWQKVQQNTMNHVQHLDTLQSKENNLLVSDITRQMVQFGHVDPANLAEAERQLPPAQFNNMMTSFMKMRNTKLKNERATQEAIAGWMDTSVMARMSPSQKDKAYEAMIEKAHQEYPEKDLWEIETQIAVSAVGSVPEYNKELTNKLNSTNPQELEQGARAFDLMNEFNPFAVNALDKNTRAMRYAYMGRIMQGRDPVTAAQEAYNAVYQKDEKQREIMNSNWNSHARSKGFDVPDNRLAFAKKMSDKSFFSYVGDPTSFANRVIANYESNYKLLNGDENAAKQKTMDAMKRNFGDTYVNGRREYQYMPLEKALGLPDNATAVIQNDMWRQLQIQFEDFKGEYDANDSLPYYYELASRDRPGDPLRAVRVWRSGRRDSFDLQSRPGGNIATTVDPANPVIGDYVFNLKSDKTLEPLRGYGPLGFEFVYRPNINAVREDYRKMFNLSEVDIKQMMMERAAQYIKKEQARKQNFQERMSEIVNDPMGLF